MNGIIQSCNRFYYLTNIFVCILCTGYLYSGYSSVNNEIQLDKTNEIVENDQEPLSEIVELESSVKEKEKVTTTVVTPAKTNTSSKKYVKPNYDSVTGSAVVDYAKNYLGLRYVSGGNSLTTGTDCSGFTKLIYKEFGITLSRSVKAQASNGKYVAKKDLQKGDLIFYGNNSNTVSHVAIYIGNGQVIHQSTPKHGVKINTMNMMVYITARRVITEKASVFPETGNDNVNDNNTNTENNVDNNINESNNTNNDNNTNNNIDNNINTGITNSDSTNNDLQNNSSDSSQNEDNKLEDNQNNDTNQETPNETNTEIYTNSEYGSSN